MRPVSLTCLLMTVVFGAHATNAPSSKLSSSVSLAVATEHTRAQLLADTSKGAMPGGEITLGLSLEHQPGWHSYWKNPGDSGLPTSLHWTLPDGVVADEIAWPTPAQFRDGPLLNFGYGGTLLLPVRLTIPADFDADVLEVALRARWLVCAEICIPETGEFALRIPLEKAAARAFQPTSEAAFAQAQTRLPIDVREIVSARVKGGLLVFGIDRLPERYHDQILELYPETGGVVDHAETFVQVWAMRTWSVRLPVSPQRSESPEFLDIVVKLPGEESGSRIRLQIAGWSSS